MVEFRRVEDKWKYLRKELYGNVECEVTLAGITVPVIHNPLEEVIYLDGGAAMEFKDSWYPCVNMKSVEMMPALAASTSYGSKEKIEGNYERAVSLNKKLINMGHHVPLECIQTVWHIGGIPKSAGSQLSRHRMCGHVSASRRYQSAKPAFVYPMLDYIESEEHVKHILTKISGFNKHSFEFYTALREGLNRAMDLVPDDGHMRTVSLHKEDARVIIPINSATERTWWCNIRELRHIFNLRLRADTESCLRNIMWKVYDTIQPCLPSLFYDFEEEMNK
jgi:flavin-dependent thymidylate synthase